MMWVEVIVRNISVVFLDTVYSIGYCVACFISKLHWLQVLLSTVQTARLSVQSYQHTYLILSSTDVKYMHYLICPFELWVKSCLEPSIDYM